MIELIKKEKDNFGKKLLIIGVFHGDETQGEYFINSYLKSHTEIGKNSIYYIPKLNPSGVRKNINGVDLNRNFPTKNWELGKKESDYFGGFKPNSETETQYLVDLIEKNNFSAIITIHAPYKTINYDGPAETLANKISEFLNYPPSADIGYATPGSFGTYCGKERNIPTITIEIDEEENLEILNKKFHKLFNYLENEY
ncbi:succinylglutamate desuccinylase/aspartoacylase family protein [bacterium]|nr:succinylglutamate desuccinylase/aspartoacylase family protein [bacterium]MBQ9149615.1 succinylglutamate desuccinylase/aspartoacylase family protein [bacterium]